MNSVFSNLLPKNISTISSYLGTPNFSLAIANKKDDHNRKLASWNSFFVGFDDSYTYYNPIVPLGHADLYHIIVKQWIKFINNYYNNAYLFGIAIVRDDGDYLVNFIDEEFFIDVYENVDRMKNLFNLHSNDHSVIRLTYIDADRSSHSNGLVVDHTHKKLSFYEPLGAKKSDKTKKSEEMKVFDMFKQIGLIDDTWSLEHSCELGSGIQTIEFFLDSNLITEQSNGLCSIWTMIFLHARLHFSEIKTNELEKFIYMSKISQSFDYTKEIKIIPRAYITFLAWTNPELVKNYVISNMKIYRNIDSYEYNSGAISLDFSGMFLLTDKILFDILFTLDVHGKFIPNYKNLENIDLSYTENLENIDFLKNYGNLKYINIHKSSIKSVPFPNVSVRNFGYRRNKSRKNNNKSRNKSRNKRFLKLTIAEDI